MTKRDSPTSVIPRKLDNHHATYFGAVIHQNATDLLNARSETRISDETLAGEGFNQPSTSHLSMISRFFRFETQVSWWNHSDSPRIHTWANINCRTSALCRMIFHVYIGCHRFSRSQFCPGITTRKKTTQQTRFCTSGSALSSAMAHFFGATRATRVARTNRWGDFHPVFRGMEG